MESNKSGYGWIAAAGIFFAGMAHADLGVTRATVHGKVSFERRETIVPEMLCRDNRNCQKSQPYWTLILQSGENHYELDQVFDLGKDSAPKNVELGQVSVHPGLTLSVEGQIDEIGPNYYLLSDVTAVSMERDTDVVDDAFETIQSTGQGGGQGSCPLYYGWSCRSVGGDHDNGHLQVAADVWYAESAEGSDGYTIRVVASIDGPGPGTAVRNSYQLVHLDHASADLKNGKLVYEGNSGDESVELDIPYIPGQTHNAASVLTLRRSVPNPLAWLPLDTTMNITCGLTRGN